MKWWLCAGGIGLFLLLTSTEEFGEYTWSDVLQPQHPVDIIEAGMSQNSQTSREPRIPPQ